MDYRKLNTQLPTVLGNAFTIIFVKYYFLKMPFVLAEGQAHFTLLMQMVLSTFNNFCFFHMDDALVHDSNEDHLEHLKIFIRIREAGLKLKVLKCAFF